MTERAPEPLPPEPLPREWLPDAVAPAEAPDPEVWELRVRRLMAAAEPRLVRLRAPAMPWWAPLAGFLRPALAMAAAAAALLLVFPGPPGAPEPSPPGRLALSALAGEGNPAAVWAELGAGGDPALVLLTLEGETP